MGGGGVHVAGIVEVLMQKLGENINRNCNSVYVRYVYNTTVLLVDGKRQQMSERYVPNRNTCFSKHAQFFCSSIFCFGKTFLNLDMKEGEVGDVRKFGLGLLTVA